MNGDLTRVSKNIEIHVLNFCSINREFHMEELTRFVSSKARGVAPDSPARILRQLRGSGVLDYVVVNRSQSLYRIKFVEKQGELF